ISGRIGTRRRKDPPAHPSRFRPSPSIAAVTSTAEDLRDVRPRRQQISLALAVLATVPALVIRISGGSDDHPIEALISGCAFIAVLPEYAVDVVFAGKAGTQYAAHGASCLPPGSTDASPCSLALANMTGSNRLLIGIGWSMVVFVAWWQWRRRGRRETEVRLERSHSVEIAFLGLATAYSLTLPLRHTISLIDSGVLVGIFAVYTWRIARSPAEEPHLV